MQVYIEYEYQGLRLNPSYYVPLFCRWLFQKKLIKCLSALCPRFAHRYPLYNPWVTLISP